jgi:death-on-curing protein
VRTRYLQLEDLTRQVERQGFIIRDLGLLASAVARPQASAFGADAYPTVSLKAAALCQSLDNNQALVDGNKRIAWLSTKVFLALNGYRLAATADAGESFMLEMVAGGTELSDIADWLRQHCTRQPLPSISDAPD